VASALLPEGACPYVQVQTATRDIVADVQWVECADTGEALEVGESVLDLDLD
jgi:hypothetical protein